MTWAAWVAAITGQQPPTPPPVTTVTTVTPDSTVTTNPPPVEPEPVLEGLCDPDYEQPAWPDGFDEASFRDHLDRLHARHMGATMSPPRRDRLRTWRDRYTREALDADRMAARLNFLAELATSCTTPPDDGLRALVVEARRGVPRVATSEVSQLDDPKHEPNPQSLGPTSVMGWFLPRIDEPDPPRCA